MREFLEKGMEVSVFSITQLNQRSNLGPPKSEAGGEYADTVLTE